MFASLKTSIATSLTALTISLALSASPADANGFRMGGGHGGSLRRRPRRLRRLPWRFPWPRRLPRRGIPSRRVGLAWSPVGSRVWSRLHRRRRRLHRVPIELRRRGQLPWPVPGECLPVTVTIDSGPAASANAAAGHPKWYTTIAASQRVCMNIQAISRCVCRITDLRPLFDRAASICIASLT